MGCVGSWRRPAAVIGGFLLAVALAPSLAEARTFVHVGIGVPLYAPPPVVYAAPPVVYGPPPVVYAPPPVAYAPPPVAYAAPREQCREYQSNSMINGRLQRVVGTACRQPDGTWRIVD